jgi:polyisoprenoid-binding protein YceI
VTDLFTNPHRGDDREAAADEWIVDPERSIVRFRSTSMWGLVKVAGTFSVLRGDGSLDRDGTATGRLEIETWSVDTGNQKRDKHLRSPSFLNALTYPVITFAVCGMTSDERDRVRVRGALTVVGYTRPLELTATVEEAADGTGATLSTSVEVHQSMWGIDSPMGVVNKTTWVDAEIRLVRSAPVASSHGVTEWRR